MKSLSLILILFSTACSLKNIDVKENDISSSNPQHELIYTSQQYSDQKLNFFPGQNLITNTDYKEVSIVDFNNNKLLEKIISPDSKITNSLFINNGKEYLLSTDNTLQIWSTQDWKLIKQLDSINLTKISGLSSDFKYLYFDGSIWLTENYEKFMSFEEGPSPNSFDFSSDNKYFITAGHYAGSLIIDLDNKKQTKLTNNIKGVKKVSFRNDNNFYASYEARLDINNGGYLSKKIGLFDVTNNELIKNFHPSSRITCWVNDPQHGLLVSLYNGDIVLLNHQFDITHKWDIEDHITVCPQANNSDIWLGSDKSGVYRLNLNTHLLTQEYIIQNTILDLKISVDNKYFGMVELIPGETISKVFLIK